jgi:hypothetical protein
MQPALLAELSGTALGATESPPTPLSPRDHARAGTIEILSDCNTKPFESRRPPILGYIGAGHIGDKHGGH